MTGRNRPGRNVGGQKRERVFAPARGLVEILLVGRQLPLSASAFPGANRISTMKYQRLFGGAEPLRLIKELETDFYPSGGIPIEQKKAPNPGKANLRKDNVR